MSHSAYGSNIGDQPFQRPGDHAGGRALALQVDDRISTVRVLQAGEVSDSGYKSGLLQYWL